MGFTETTSRNIDDYSGLATHLLYLLQRVIILVFFLVLLVIIEPVIIIHQFRDGTNEHTTAHLYSLLNILK